MSEDLLDQSLPKDLWNQTHCSWAFEALDEILQKISSPKRSNSLTEEPVLNVYKPRMRYSSLNESRLNYQALDELHRQVRHDKRPPKMYVPLWTKPPPLMSMGSLQLSLHRKRNRTCSEKSLFEEEYNVCAYCKNMNLHCYGHTKKNCPALAALRPCLTCGAMGMDNHTASHCPYQGKTILKLKKEFEIRWLCRHGLRSTN